MVSIIENWSTIEGVVKSISENEVLQGYQRVELELLNSFDVEGFPNLAKADEGKVISINVRPEQVSEYNIKVGDTLSGTVRKAFGQVYFIR